MKDYKIVAIRRTYQDDSVSLYGDIRFCDSFDEIIARGVACIEVKDSLQDYKKVELCFVNACWNYQVQENKIYNEIELTPEIIDRYIDDAVKLTNYYIHDCNTEERLEILPETIYNDRLRKKTIKIRKNNKCIDWTKQDSNIDWDNAGFWYFHGKLQDEVGYDKGVVLNCGKVGLTIPTVYWTEIRGDVCTSYIDTPYKTMKADGIYKCNVIGVNGDCIGFFWTINERTIKYDKGTFQNWEQRGLVVQRNDIEGLLFAFNKYLSNETML